VPVVNRAPTAFAAAALPIHASFTQSRLSFPPGLFTGGMTMTSQPAYGRAAIRAGRSFAGNSRRIVVRVLGRDARPDAGAAASGLARL